VGCAIDGGGQNVRLQHHAHAATGRMVVHRAVAIFGERPDIMGGEGPHTLLQGAARKRMAERPRKHLREQAENGCGKGHLIQDLSGPAVLAALAFVGGVEVTIGQIDGDGFRHLRNESDGKQFAGGQFHEVAGTKILEAGHRAQG
jgi:hypothetical protein